MRISRGFRSAWLLATSLLMAGAAAPATDAVRVPSPPHSAAGNAARLSHGRFKDFLVY